MDEKNSDRMNNDKAKEIQKLLVNPDHLSLLEKQILESFQTTDSKTMPNASTIIEDTINKTDSKPQSFYDKNMFNIQELYETQNIKNANENYVQSLLEKQMQNLKSASFTNEKNKQFGNDRSSVDYNFDKGNLMNGSDPRIFELRLPQDNSDILNESKLRSNARNYLFNPITEFTLIPIDSQMSHEKVLDHLSTVKEIENDQKMSLNIDKQYVSKSNKYMLIRTIGRGNFAKVKLAKHMTTDKFVAIKIIDKTKLSSKILVKVSREVKLMKELNHPNIVKLLEVMENESTLYLVMEYASGGELFDYLVIHGCMKEKEARLKFRQMISAVHYCHSKFIVHRDLKAENMLLNSKMEIKIVDFGFANNFNPKSKLSTFCGSPPYAAPELFLGQRYVGPEVDVWSLGVILFTLVSGRLPFDANTLKELKDKVLNLRYEFPYFISNDCENLLRKILTVNPKERATLSDLMNDPWINGGGLLRLTPHIETTEITVDNRKLNKLIVMGYEREYVIKSVIEKKFNAVYATYQLLSLSSSDSYNKKVDDKSKRQALGFSEKEQQKQAKSLKDLTESISDFDKTPKEIISRSITGNSVNQFAKSFKKWFKQKPENMDTLTPEETLDSIGGPILNKEFQKQFQLAQSLDPNASLPIGANQQALIATLNQMSWSKTGKAAMFQQHSIGSIRQPVIEKNQITAAPISWMADHFSRKTSPEPREVSKFTVENVKITHSFGTVNSIKSDISDNIPRTSSQIKSIKSKMTQAFSGKSKQNDDEKSTNTENSLSKIKKIIEKCDIEKTKLKEKLKPYFIGKDDFSEFLKSRKHQQNENDIFSSKNKPRIGRFAFSMNTISSKDPDLLMEEVIRILKENEFNYEYIEKYLLLCWNTTVESDTFTDSIQWEMEICRIPLLYVHGVRMKRIFGSSFAYKTIALKITRSLKL